MSNTAVSVRRAAAKVDRESMLANALSERIAEPASRIVYDRVHSVNAGEVRHTPRLIRAEVAAHCRQAISNGEYQLKPVQTREVKGPVTDDQHRVVAVLPGIRSFKKATLRHVKTREVNGPVTVDQHRVHGVLRSIMNFKKTNLRRVRPSEVNCRVRDPMLPAIVNFNKTKLRSVQTKETTGVQVIGQVELSAEQKATIKRFPSTQLNHVQPKVTHSVVVRPVEEKQKANLAAKPKADDRSKLMTAIKSSTQLNHVATKVTHYTVVRPAVNIEVKAESKMPQAKAEQPKKVDPTAEQLKAALAKVEQLVELGFTDKKANFLALMANGNDLVKAVETLLDQ